MRATPVRALAWAIVACAAAVALAAAVAERVVVRPLRRLAEAVRRRDEELAEAARRRDGELEEARRLAAVGQLAGGIAHDFNNLLTIVLASASALREQLPAGHAAQEDAREIVAAAERATALTRQLLACSRLRAGDARETAPASAGEAPSGTGNVLLVEDDPHQRGVVRRALASHGYGVRAVGNAADARGLEGAAPDLVVTDVVLPDGNGIDLARELAARWPASAFLFVSGYTGEHLQAVGSLPADARLLPKPFSAETLLLRVREVLERRPRAA